jgi:hypothetical protein
MKAQKKPVIIDFHPISQLENLDYIKEWVQGFGDNFDELFQVEANHNSNHLFVKTLEGTSYNVTSEDVIIRGIKGEYYPCKKDVFADTYDIISE